MGRHVAAASPAMDRLVDETIAGIGSEIEALHIPKLRGVVLGGGYGRGEGGVARDAETGEEHLYNDLDFFAITEDGVSSADLTAVGAQLEPVSKRWTEKLGIDVDFTVRTPWRIRHDQERLMIQELLHGYFDVAGAKGEVLFAGVESRSPSAFPWMEAARLMMNRGVGLLLAHETLSSQPSTPFVLRNINKCILGVGDARLIACRGYRWKVEDRAATLKDELYAKAMAWKFRPRPESVCDWETARETWLTAFDEVMAAGAGTPECRRSIYSTVRWIVRRKSLGEIRTLGLNPVVRILRQIAVMVRERRPLSPALKKDWLIFN